MKKNHEEKTKGTKPYDRHLFSFMKKHFPARMAGADFTIHNIHDLNKIKIELLDVFHIWHSQYHRINGFTTGSTAYVFLEPRRRPYTGAQPRDVAVLAMRLDDFRELNLGFKEAPKADDAPIQAIIEVIGQGAGEALMLIKTMDNALLASIKQKSELERDGIRRSISYFCGGETSRKTMEQGRIEARIFREQAELTKLLKGQAPRDPKRTMKI